MNKFIAFFAVALGFAQPSANIPSGYYATATGTGYVLKTQLYNIIKNNTNSSSEASYGDLWDLYTGTAFRDHFYENDNTLLDIYSEKPNGTDSYNYSGTSQQCGNYASEGDCYNREHVLPQSVFNSVYPMYSDAHFVLPSDGKVNGMRSNYPFGKVASTSWTSTNGSKLGSNLNSGYSSGYTGTVFEPIDEFKGDIARALLYFATRYEDQVSGWEYDMFNGSSTQVFTNTFKNILLTWHQSDPVSTYEIGKNDAVYAFQNNRNPYIDHPEWVTTVWGSVLENNTYSTTEITLYPNPTSDVVFINSPEPILELRIYNANGQEVEYLNLPDSKVSLSHLAKGLYWVELQVTNVRVFKKISIQ